jgi:hydroxymethylpyrimidine/phosphomethylpyrimidine kinase
MRLNQVTLSSRDVERSKSFFLALGLKLIVDGPPRYARFVCPDRDSSLSVEVREHDAPGGAVVYFECNDLDATVARLKAAGMTFDSGPIDQPWLWREAHLRDPDGNMLCLFRAGEPSSLKLRRSSVTMTCPPKHLAEAETGSIRLGA